uniref:MSP domain-containing protein n=1 Tax=Heterorhabditis bacteriophora TaxID=37862 RepID=A0A1I7XDH2_HETBA
MYQLEEEMDPAEAAEKDRVAAGGPGRYVAPGMRGDTRQGDRRHHMVLKVEWTSIVDLVYMGLLTILRKQREKEREMRVLILGLDNAGKTTIMKKFLGEDLTTIEPTLGFNIKTVDFRGFTLNLWDVGGQTSLRSYWRNYFEQTDALVWVVDSCDSERLLCSTVTGENLLEAVEWMCDDVASRGLRGMQINVRRCRVTNRSAFQCVAAVDCLSADCLYPSQAGYILVFCKYVDVKVLLGGFPMNDSVDLVFHYGITEFMRLIVHEVQYMDNEEEFAVAQWFLRRLSDRVDMRGIRYSFAGDDNVKVIDHIMNGTVIALLRECQKRELKKINFEVNLEPKIMRWDRHIYREEKFSSNSKFDDSSLQYTDENHLEADFADFLAKLEQRQEEIKETARRTLVQQARLFASYGVVRQEKAVQTPPPDEIPDEAFVPELPAPNMVGFRKSYSGTDSRGVDCFVDALFEFKKKKPILDEAMLECLSSAPTNHPQLESNEAITKIMARWNKEIQVIRTETEKILQRVERWIASVVKVLHMKSSRGKKLLKGQLKEMKLRSSKPSKARLDGECIKCLEADKKEENKEGKREEEVKFAASNAFDYIMSAQVEKKKCGVMTSMDKTKVKAERKAQKEKNQVDIRAYLVGKRVRTRMLPLNIDVESVTPSSTIQPSAPSTLDAAEPGRRKTFKSSCHGKYIKLKKTTTVAILKFVDGAKPDNLVRLCPIGGVTIAPGATADIPFTVVRDSSPSKGDVFLLRVLYHGVPICPDVPLLIEPRPEDEMDSLLTEMFDPTDVAMITSLRPPISMPRNPIASCICSSVNRNFSKEKDKVVNSVIEEHNLEIEQDVRTANAEEAIKDGEYWDTSDYEIIDVDDTKSLISEEIQDDY